LEEINTFYAKFDDMEGIEVRSVMDRMRISFEYLKQQGQMNREVAIKRMKEKEAEINAKFDKRIRNEVKGLKNDAFGR